MLRRRIAPFTKDEMLGELYLQELHHSLSTPPPSGRVDSQPGSKLERHHGHVLMQPKVVDHLPYRSVRSKIVLMRGFTWEHRTESLKLCWSPYFEEGFSTCTLHLLVISQDGLEYLFPVIIRLALGHVALLTSDFVRRYRLHQMIVL